jgi:putative tryptophan/tyrosine transport system substrate-binding protein
MEMRRREFLGVLGAAAAVVPFDASAHQVGRVYRLGFVHPLPRPAAQFAPLFDGLRRQGFIEGRNLAVDARGFGSRPERYKDILAEIVSSSVDVIFCGGDGAMRAAREVTQTVPIVGVADDMVGSGIVASLARPGGNATGFSILAPELDSKRQELLIELVPGARRMAALFDPASKAPAQLKAIVDDARSRGVELSTYPVSRVEDIVPAIDAAHAAGASALNTLATVVLHANRQLIIERTAMLRMPAMYQFPESAEQGGFVGYGPRLDQIYRQVAVLVARLFRGERPQDVPAEQPTTFELVINLKTANSIGLEVPETFLIRADKVVE